MAIEVALIKPVIDAIMALVKGGKGAVAKATAEKGLEEALVELWKIDPNESEVEARIAIAKATGLINSNLVHVERRLEQVRATRSPSRTVAKKVGKKTTKSVMKRASKKLVARKVAKKAAF